MLTQQPQLPVHFVDPKTILLVEDSGFFRKAAQDRLTQSGYSVEAVVDGHAALEKLKHALFDLIILDIFMPRLNGVALIRMLKSSPRLKGIPVIVLSSVEQRRDVEQIESLGVRHLIRKTPTALDQLASAVSDLTAVPRTRSAAMTQEDQFASIFANSADMIFTLDLQGRVTDLNPAAELISGFRRDDAIGRSFTDALAEAERDIAYEMMRKKLAGAVSTTYSIVLRTKSGRSVPIELSTQLIRRNGTPVGFQGIGRLVSSGTMVVKKDPRDPN